MGMMGGAFKRGKQEEKGPKDDKKGGDKKKDNKADKPPLEKRGAPEVHKAAPPRVQVIAPGAMGATPAVIAQRRVLPVGEAQLVRVTSEVMQRRRLQEAQDPATLLQPQAKALNPADPRGLRRASMPVTASPSLHRSYLSPHDVRGQQENPETKPRRRSTALPYRRRSFNVVKEDEYVKDPLECLLPTYPHSEKLNIPPVRFSMRCVMYVDSALIGIAVGILLALVVKGFLVVACFAHYALG